MDFIDQLKQLGEKVIKLKDQISTEEATKTAFIMPFINTLGYDIFDPREVVPEFVADIGVKKGEKVDYAIFKDSQPIILVECKHWSENLLNHNEQLFRYFAMTKAKFGILTNGINYMIFTDLAEPNIMDPEPFLHFNITEIKDAEVEELKKFHKSYFVFDDVYSSASNLKYTNAIKKIFSDEIKNPSPEFTRYFTSKVYTGRLVEKTLNNFIELVKKSIQQVISDTITDRLKNALSQENATEKGQSVQSVTVQPNVETKPVEDSKIVTTEEEIEAYHIVKSILRKKIPVSRVTYRDQQTYFGILLDDNNRKPICRLFILPTKKYIVLFDESRSEVKFDITSVDDIFKYADNLEKTVEMYDKPAANSNN